MHILEIRRGEMELVRFRLQLGETVIGSDPGCDITLTDDGITGTHAALTCFPEGCFFREYGKAEDEHAAEPLQPGAQFKIGPWACVYRHETNRVAGASDGLGDGTTVVALGAMGESIRIRKVRLVIISPSGEERRIALKSDISIGKRSDNDLMLDDDTVSGRHCRLFFRGGRVMVRDVGSTNGTFIDRIRVVEGELPGGTELLIGKTRLKLEYKEEVEELRDIDGEEIEGLVGNSSVMRQAAGLLRRIAPSDLPVLLLGETGTGKEIMARAIHRLGRASEAPFVAVNCGAISKELVESELFGHERGAFTGAQQRRAGAFEMANGGTLFLDEIGELPFSLQPNLLRVLEQGDVVRVGSTTPIKVSVRIIAATHRNLLHAVEEQRFREDLFYRLHVLPIHIAPLRAREGDVVRLARHFLRESSEGRELEFSVSALEKLKQHDWPGNVRELKNCIARAIIFCRGDRITADDIQLVHRGVVGQSISLEDSERQRIEQVLKECEWNKSMAARKLGIAKSTLHIKISKYELEPLEPDDAESATGVRMR